LFRGGFEYTIDDKGRVIIPNKFRAKLGEKFIVTKGMGGCLLVLEDDEWRTSFDDKFKGQSVFDQHSIRLQRFFCAEATDVTPDGQGRIAIPSSLREFAKISLQSEVMIVGMQNRVEIWSKACWKAFNDNITDDDIVASAMATGLVPSAFGETAAPAA
jgi:MraZ protein